MQDRQAQNIAAINLQRIHAENRTETDPKRKNAATNLQKIQRGKIARQQVTKKRNATTHLQRTYRGRLARKRIGVIRGRHAKIRRVFNRFTPPSHNGHMI